MKVQELTKNISIRFNPEMDPIATIKNPSITNDVKVPTDDSVSVTNPNAKHGVCLTFPISNFEIEDRKCIRNYRKFCRQLIELGREFCIELSDELIDALFGSNATERLSLWFIGEARPGLGTIGITWDKTQ